MLLGMLPSNRYYIVSVNPGEWGTPIGEDHLPGMFFACTPCVGFFFLSSLSSWHAGRFLEEECRASPGGFVS